MDINLARTAVTLVAMLGFFLIVGWAYSGRNKKQFDEMAVLPLDDDVGGRS